jgi:hypothetical protein
LVVSWSDDDSKNEVEVESARYVTALNSVCISYTDSCDEDVTYDELAASYKDLLTRYEEACRILKKQKKAINKLQVERNDELAKVAELQNEVTQSNSQLEDLKKCVKQMNPGTDVLEKILEKQIPGKPKGLGFNYGALNKQQQSQDNKFVPATGTYDPSTGNVMLEHPKPHRAPKAKKRSQP